MSRIKANQITNQAADGAPTVQHGLIIAGVSTFTGSVSIGGTLTYEDVTNIDSVGVVTARSGVITPNVDVDDFISVGSNIHLGNAGVVTATSFVGNGAALTGLSGVSVANQSDNRLITATGTLDSLNGEQYLTYDGQTLNVNGTSNDTPLIVDTTNSNGAHMRFRTNGSSQHFVGSGGGISLGDNQDLSMRAYDNMLFASGNNSTERLRLTSQGTVFVKAEGTAPVNQAEAGHYSGTGYNAGDAMGLMVKRAIHVSDADTKGVGGMFLSHTRNVACNGTTYNMFTLHNREGTFVGDIYVGFSGNSSGAVRHYKFTCLYNTNTLTSVDFNRRSNNDNLTCNISSSNTAHFFQVIPTKSGGGTERVSMTIVGACCGRNDGAGGDFYTVSYNS